MSVETVAQGIPNAHDPEIILFIPSNDESEPVLSIVVPALNERITIGDFVEWCHEGIKKAGVRGEILIIDSSSDDTPFIALARGARVLKTPKRGLGRAYIDALPYIRGKYVIMGDSDCTYDFREIKPFIERFVEGFEFIMGSRFRGFIEPGSMPPLHRYLGTPVTTWVLNRMYSGNFSDIHCGMRGITTEAFKKIDLHSQSWEYASEMVLKAVRWKLNIAEVPIRFLKDRNGRLSHHKRAGWFSPWAAAWINLRAMFIYGADFFLLKPGLLVLLVGLLLTIPIVGGPVTIGRISFSLYWMLFGFTLTVLGLQASYMGILARILYDFRNTEGKSWLRIFEYNRTAGICFTFFLIGIFLNVPLMEDYLSGAFIDHSGSPLPSSYLSVFGMELMICSMITFTFTLVLHAATIIRRPRS